jgi:hypothetical protein
MRLGLFLLPLVILAAYAEHRMSEAYNTLFYKEAKVKVAADKIEVLILGSSHALFGLNPDTFGRPGFNLAGVSQTLYYDQHLLEGLLPSLDQLDHVVLTISYFSLWHTTGLQEDWRESFYTRAWGASPESGRIDWRACSYVAMYSLPVTRRYLLGDYAGFVEENPVAPNGWQGVAIPPKWGAPVSDEGGQWRLEEHHRIMDQSRLAAQSSYLRQIVEILQERGIRPLILTPPAQPTYWQNFDPEYWEPAEAFLAELCEEKQIPWLNLLQDTRFYPSDFFDNDHVNSVGAEKLSRIVAAALEDEP